MARNWIAQIADHPGATLEEIQNEPNWTAGRNHRVGYKNSENRVPGYNRDPDPFLEELHDKEVAAEADEQLERLRNKANHEKLINFRDIVQGIKDFHLVHPALRPTGWRYMLECTEDWVKYKQRWPCNLRREEKRQEEQEKEKEKEKEQSQQDGQTDKGESKAKEGKEKEDEKETKEDETNEGNEQSEENDQDKKKSLFARELRQELQHMNSLEDNDGLGPSPQAEPRLDTTIDEADQFSPDNWFPRSENLVRATGSFPMNAEPGLPQLFQSGLITPNHLHYVRNHGAVPRLHWEFHEVGVADGKNERVFNMEDLTTQFPAINIPVFIACDGNRRKELSKIRSAQGAPFGPAAGGCAYWKGPMLRDILLAAGVQDPHSSGANKKKAAGWVNFEGADELPEGKYATSIPLDYAMDPRNDVILAFQMNDKPLPPDHGYPIRVVIPGYVGGRCVKWLRRIWTSEKENDSYYHIWDNRVLPSFIESTGDELAEALYHQASSRCDAQSLNSVIASPEPGEKISLSSDVGGTYRVQGFAYNGSARMIHRVEVSLDNGASWRYCFRRFPDRPVRHSNKYWTWIHWYLDVPVLDLANGKEIAVRCFDTSNTAQPEHPSWNVLGMMNNGWYRVRFEVCQNEKGNNRPVLLCQHPVEPGMLKGGWMKPSFENQLEQQKVEALGSGSQKKLTREEIEKHDKDGDCWIVVDGRVYDATSVLSWHPGGSGIILTHAGRVHPKTSTEFNSVHDSYARKQLQGHSHSRKA
jgi:nitrate reductase (NAD(P)H)